MAEVEAKFAELSPKLDDLARAILPFLRCRAINPSYHPAQLVAGWIYMLRGQYSQATLLGIELHRTLNRRRLSRDPFRPAVVDRWTLDQKACCRETRTKAFAPGHDQNAARAAGPRSSVIFRNGEAVAGGRNPADGDWLLLVAGFKSRLKKIIPTCLKYCIVLT